MSSRSVPGGKSIRTPGGRDVSHQPSADESPALCVCVRVCLVGHYCVCMCLFSYITARIKVMKKDLVT